MKQTHNRQIIQPVMNVSRQNRTRLLMFFMLWAVLCVPAAYAMQYDAREQVINLESQADGQLSLADYQGQVVMINFWASWCAPCRQEMPILEALYQRYESAGFTLLGVNVDENSEQAIEYLQEVTVSFPVLLDTTNEISKAYDVIAMPSTILVGRDGTLRYIHHGYQPGYEDEYLNQIRELIRE
jgi:thiol-disulfide isomerase/thioredoxin